MWFQSDFHPMESVCSPLVWYHTYEGRAPTVQSLLNRDYVHYVDLNELWIPWKKFGPLACCYGDIVFLQYWLKMNAVVPPQGYQKNWLSNFDLKLSIQTDLKENSIPFAPGVPYMGRRGFSLYARINMTPSTVWHKYLRSSIYHKDRKTNSDDDFTVNMHF